ncbi:hypothetical protein BU24DRAFT_423500 [Aaosphaeria arxii CBS 175.79]|uniref:Uncharacterized protein n=1 Tax=Aaosphaeria arxii CBS 175.79 TaxID=1450172 RepID=A0A6A5XN84_9PLEO|nr:uncharacterized protein BU24DRAFT_423500 [Aaosphaeria arxii CBS 175.79]KAF2014592.1 hypothetical protein BU24DRAFT_423500 [Aaosphaeria arxii CBS 175.79]
MDLTWGLGTWELGLERPAGQVSFKTILPYLTLPFDALGGWDRWEAAQHYKAKPVPDSMAMRAGRELGVFSSGLGRDSLGVGINPERGQDGKAASSNCASVLCMLVVLKGEEEHLEGLGSVAMFDGAALISGAGEQEKKRRRRAITEDAPG